MIVAEKDHMWNDYRFYDSAHPEQFNYDSSLDAIQEYAEARGQLMIVCTGHIRLQDLKIIIDALEGGKDKSHESISSL